MIKTIGAMIKRFYNDDSAWPEDSWHEDEDLLVDGEPIGDRSFDDIPDDAAVILSGGVVFGLPNGTETSMELHFKRWLKRQTTTVVLVECDHSAVDQVKAAVKAAGGRVR